MAIKRTYFLQGLTCANCAGKIENEISQLPVVNQATINLMNQKLTVELNDEHDITDAVKKIVISHEAHVKVLDFPSGSKALKAGAKPKHHGEEHRANHNHGNAAEDHTHDGESGQYKIYFARLIGAGLISLIVSLFDIPNVIALPLLFVAYLMAGYEILFNAVKNIIKGKVFDENFLMTIASIGAFAIGEHIEAVAVLIFYGLGEALQEMAVHRSRKNITSLMDIRPDYANLIVKDGVKRVSPDEVEVGSIIQVKPGEKVPLDGVIIKGSSYIDARALTGESVPIEAKVNDKVYSGSINTSGLIEVEVTKVFGESTVSIILDMVENAGSKKAESEKFITKFARYYTPVVVIGALLVAVVPPIMGIGTFSEWVYKALSFLIISCPCALVISIPLSFFGGIGGSAKHGILIKGGNFLEALNQVHTVVLDKTGTLTKGVFEVSKIITEEGTTEEEIMELAAIAEQYSSHPIGKSILSYYQSRWQNHEIDQNISITELAGKGIIGDRNNGNEVIYAGNHALMEEYQIDYKATNEMGTIVYIASNQKYYGAIVISDEMKEGASETLRQLKHLGVKNTVMLTGDRKERAEEIGALCGVDIIHSELLPQDKVAWFEHYQQEGNEKGKVIFVGDGINDAPVLARADIGIAMGAVGSDAAIEASDVVIMNDDIRKLEMVIKVARKTRQIVMQNIVFALGIKILIMVLSIFGISSIWFAIFADVGVALLALLNAMRAMYIR